MTAPSEQPWASALADRNWCVEGFTLVCRRACSLGAHSGGRPGLFRLPSVARNALAILFLVRRTLISSLPGRFGFISGFFISSRFIFLFSRLIVYNLEQFWVKCI